MKDSDICAEFWENELDAPPFILETVKEGYKIPFESHPPPFYARNNRSSLQNKHFVKDSILKLFKNKCIIETDIPPHCTTDSSHNFSATAFRATTKN